MKYLNEQEIIQYCKDNNIDPSICYCKECGKFLAYDNAVFHINQATKKLVTDDNKLSFLSTRNYNGNEYHLCRCYDCVCNKFPNFNLSLHIKQQNIHSTVLMFLMKILNLYQKQDNVLPKKK